MKQQCHTIQPGERWLKDTHTDGTDFISLTADTGGKNLNMDVPFPTFNCFTARVFRDFAYIRACSSADTWWKREPNGSFGEHGVAAYQKTDWSHTFLSQSPGNYISIELWGVRLGLPWSSLRNKVVFLVRQGSSKLIITGLICHKTSDYKACC